MVSPPVIDQAAEIDSVAAVVVAASVGAVSPAAAVGVVASAGLVESAVTVDSADFAGPELDVTAEPVSPVHCGENAVLADYEGLVAPVAPAATAAPVLVVFAAVALELVAAAELSAAVPSARHSGIRPGYFPSAPSFRSSQECPSLPRPQVSSRSVTGAVSRPGGRPGCRCPPQS